VSRLDEARFQVDSLISEGVHYGTLVALTSVSLHYGGINFDANGLGYVPRKSESNILAIGSATTQGTEVLASKMLAASIRLLYQSSSV
jgi:hypothetical protein